MHPYYNGYAVLGTLKIVNLILWTFGTYARSIPILLSISASLLNGHAMIKGIWLILSLLSSNRNSVGIIFTKNLNIITGCVI